MTDIVTRLRQTRADMIGTDDEQHYWDCHDAAAEIERLRGDLEVRRLQLEAAASEVERLRLTDAERASMTRAIETLEGVEYMEAFRTENDATAAATLRGLLERLTDEKGTAEPSAASAGSLAYHMRKTTRNGGWRI